ncbi:MAG: thiamine-monophosphate kinase [Planctomycetes bacterium]|nr:thiamine-monophosphate kinase [Planctomycetota bacterium]
MDTTTKGESALVRWLTEQQSPMAAHIPLGIGDDMCIVAAGHETVLLSSDLLLDGVHFDSARHSLESVGRKALACGLSDCAAMAVQPRAATVSVALPNSFSLSHAKALYAEMKALGERFECPVTGGDTTSWNHPLAIDVTVMACPYPGLHPILRSGAQPGDGLYVTGPLGGSLLGRHLTFEPRVHEAHRLAKNLGSSLHAMLDISDGLALDLHRLCASSKVGARLDESLLQEIVHDDAVDAARGDGRSELDHVLGDGEDFELLLAASGDSTESVAGVRLHRVGEIVASDVVIRRRDGRVEPLAMQGYEHFR